MEDTEILQDTTPELEQLPPTLQKIEMKQKIQCLQVQLSQQRKKTKNALKKSSELKKALSCLKGYLLSDSSDFIESQVVKAQKSPNLAINGIKRKNFWHCPYTFIVKKHIIFCPDCLCCLPSEHSSMIYKR